MILDRHLVKETKGEFVKVRKLTAVALGASAVAAPTAVGAQEDPAVAVATEDPASAAAPTCTAGDYRKVKTDNLWLFGDPSLGQTAGVVELWYSPSTRCVFGQVKGTSPAASGGTRSYGAVIRIDEVHNTHQVVDCEIPAGQRSCSTPRIYDGEIPGGGGRNFKAAAAGDLWVGGPQEAYLFRGKTVYY